ncbi:hypothetical protein STCU_11621 [Strigomonas culicis]|uniref:Uncharacterized protein n=1 Tax=Strigomonas culicis TaxID=28005 RepID=S9TDA5_9TRYP|nr:hypothetical protein STCU_11621 [Strigomonas culicis]|eukprot:EPY15997.1 hypothetical protein STCU_11621 [Strigomonas culicis]
MGDNDSVPDAVCISYHYTTYVSLVASTATSYTARPAGHFGLLSTNVAEVNFHLFQSARLVDLLKILIIALLVLTALVAGGALGGLLRLSFLCSTTSTPLDVVRRYRRRQIGCCGCGCRLIGGSGVLLAIALAAAAAAIYGNQKLTDMLLHTRFDTPTAVPDNETYATCDFMEGCVTSFSRDGFRGACVTLNALMALVALSAAAVEGLLWLMGGSRYYVERAAEVLHLEAAAPPLGVLQLADGNAHPVAVQVADPSAAAADAASGNINDVMNRHAGGHSRNVRAARTEQGAADEREPLIH